MAPSYDRLDVRIADDLKVGKQCAPSLDRGADGPVIVVVPVTEYHVKALSL